VILTQHELDGQAKGYGRRFDEYVDIDAPIRISPEDYAKLVAFSEPYMAQRIEVQGAVTFHFEAGGIRIERVYAMGGNSQAFRTTCLLDPDDMLRQMQADYPERTQFMSNEVGWWHLHPGYYPSLSVGDVEECRAGLSYPDAKVLQLLMYGDPRGGYQLSGYLVGLDEVNRLPVRIDGEMR
jgi:hypothetical protein